MAAPHLRSAAASAFGARLGMPKPIVLCPWDRRRRLRILAGLRRLARNATAEEPVFYEDEMDVHLNPKIEYPTMRPSIDFRMSIGVEPMKMRTDRGIVSTGYRADASARRYAGSVPAGNRSRRRRGA